MRLRSKHIGLTLIILIVLMLSACNQSAPDAAMVAKETPFIGGSNGLSIKFVPGAPPEEITDNAKFPFGVSVQVENLGEADIFEAGPNVSYIELQGMNPIDFGVGVDEAAPIRFLKAPVAVAGNIAGARKNFDGTVIPGGQTIVSFPFDPAGGDFDRFLYMPDIRGNTALTVRADACYNYKTRSSTKICVKKDLLSPTERAAVCELTDPKTAHNSGAPIHVTKVSEAPIGEHKIQVTFNVEHVGESTGTFYTHNHDCDDRITNPNKYVVYVDVISDINGETAHCTGLEVPSDIGPDGEPIRDEDGNPPGFVGTKQHAGFVRLFRGAPRTVTCTIDISHIDNDFEELFEVELSYRYSTTIETKILVKDVTLVD